MVMEVLMSKIMIVTDSTANIPANVLDGLPIKVIPLQLIWGQSVLADGLDITPTEFYQRLATDSVLPTTSQATPEEFKKEYKHLLDENYDILSIHISSKLSGTLDSAFQAKSAFPGSPIELVDSLSTSMAMGFQVLAAARVAAQGGSLLECKAVAEKARQQTGVYFALETLEYLKRGGRIGSASAFLGSVLNLKPILAMRDGVIEPVEKVRTFSRTVARLLDLVEAKFENEPGPVRLCAIHGNSPEAAQQLLDLAVTRFSDLLVSESMISDISPVIGAHAGPGALGLAYMVGM
jgi:DegV family protein with EDD domain